MTAGAAASLAARECALEDNETRIEDAIRVLRILETQLAALGLIDEPAAEAYSAGSTLALPDAWCGVYVWYLAAEWHLSLGEGGRYENARARFETELAALRAALRRRKTLEPAQRWKLG